jgi:hypothetical protein
MALYANKWRSVVNQKAGENFDVGNECLPVVDTFRTLASLPAILELDVAGGNDSKLLKRTAGTDGRAPG